MFIYLLPRSQYKYYLTLRTDLYTKKHTQWFYFQVSGMEAGVTYTFYITNLMKKDSLYNYGQSNTVGVERLQCYVVSILQVCSHFCTQRLR